MAFKSPKKPSKSQKLAEELHQQLLDNVQNLVTSDAWPKLLAAVVKTNGTELGRFSFNNLLFVLAQYPEATALATMEKWNDLGRSIVKGSKSIRVRAPLTVKDTDREGTERTKTVGYRLIPEFDVSQTQPTWQDGDAPMFITPALTRPTLANTLEGAAPEEMSDALVWQIQGLGYSVEFGNTGDAMGLTNPKTKTVLVSNNASAAQAAQTLAHELGHIMADHVADMAAYSEHRGVMETVAESFAWMVSQHYGLDATAYSAPYIGSWAGREDSERVLKTVQQVGAQVLAMFRTFVAKADGPVPATL